MTDLYVKPTARHQFLHYTSSHPDHSKGSIAFSQALRASRICSGESDFLKLKHLKKMKSWFLVRGYPKYLIEAEMKKVTLTSEYRKTKRGRLLKVVPFVMADHPISTSIKKVILKYLDLLYIDKEVKRVFILKPMISFRSARKVSSYLVRAKLYPPKELKNPISVVENTLRSA